MQKGPGRVQREERGPSLTKERKVHEKLLLKGIEPSVERDPRLDPILLLRILEKH